MKRNKLWPVLVSLLLLFAAGHALAQKSKTQKSKKPSTQKTTTQKKPQKSTPPKKTTAPAAESKSAGNKKPAEQPSSDPAQDEQKVKDIIAFLEFMLNTLGDEKTSTRDKDVMINESYTKIFRDAKVQIEDDLDEEREVITNKDVTAYLKDVDFFFRNVKFTFVVEGVQRSVMADGNLFYKVSLRRTLTGITSDGLAVNNTKPRFAEINYDPNSQDLKIVSLYTNLINEKEALTAWWKGLSYEWQSVFKKKLNITADSLSFSDIKTVTSLRDLDLSDNRYIQDIEPLSELSALKLLNLSHTQIGDLTPIRNLSELVELDVSGTRIFDLAPLQYCNKLQRLNINGTDVRSIAVLEKLTALQNLEMASTDVFDFTSLSRLPNLVHVNVKGTQITELSSVSGLQQLLELNASATPVEDLSPLKDARSLQTLLIDSTRVRDLGPLANLTQLHVLHANYTLVTDLQPIAGLTQLEKIYLDQTSLSREKADAFRVQHPRTLVVYETKDLNAWWEKLDPEWRTVLSRAAHVQAQPSKEELAKVTTLDSLILTDNPSIRNLEAARRLRKLKVLRANKTAISDLSPLQEHTDLQLLDISETNVSDLSGIMQSTKLKQLLADNSKVEKLDPLFGMKALAKVYVDHTPIQDINAREFLEHDPKCLLVYKTVHLNRWWSSLSNDWKEVFRSQMGNDTTASRENLHTLVERPSLKFRDASVPDLSALTEFINLNELQFSGTGIHAIPFLENLQSLKILHATSSPIDDVGSISKYTALEDLDLSNTPIDDLKPLGGLENLKKLNCAGTQIKKLDALENLFQLEVLDCSNTRTGSLDPVEHLPLKTLKCYNTKVSGKDVERLKKKNPECNVVFYR